MLKLLLCIVFLAIVPSLIGGIYLKFMENEKNNFALSIILGYFTEFSIFELISLIFIFKGKTFSLLFYTVTVIYVILSIISIILNRKNFKDFFKSGIDFIKETPKVLTLILVLLIGIECYTVFNYMHIDQDDSDFVAKATISIDADSLFVYDDIGNEYKEFPARRVLSPFPIYTAIVSEWVGFHPAAVAHTLFPVLFTLLIYCTYYVMGKKLFKGNLKDSILFLIFVNIIYIFGNYSRRTNFTFMLIRLWQGKAVLGNFILPAIITLYMLAIENKEKFIYWLAIFMVMGASCLVSTMGFALAPILLVSLTLVHCFIKIDWKNLKKSILPFVGLATKSAICCLPNLVCVIMYLLLKGGAL